MKVTYTNPKFKNGKVRTTNEMTKEVAEQYAKGCTDNGMDDVQVVEATK